MKAVGLTRYLPTDHPECFVDLDLPDPQLGPRDVLVRVQAVSVNPVDVKLRAPRADVEREPKVFGWDAAGEVIATGAEVRLYVPGDRVYYAGDITRPGCNSLLHAVDERIAGRMPASLDYAGAAALPLTALTAWEALFEQLQVQQDEGRDATILIIGGAGGVGSMAIQLAHCAGLQVIATVSRRDSAAWCHELGADRVVDHTRDLVALWRDLDLPAPRYILCCADTDAWFDTMAQLVAPRGRICALSSASRPHDIQALMRKAAGFVWENMFAKSRFGLDDLESQRRILDQVADRIDDGLLRSTLREVVGPLDARHLAQAHAAIESGRTVGKLALRGIAAQAVH